MPWRQAGERNIWKCLPCERLETFAKRSASAAGLGQQRAAFMDVVAQFLDGLLVKAREIMALEIEQRRAQPFLRAIAERGHLPAHALAKPIADEAEQVGQVVAVRVPARF